MTPHLVLDALVRTRFDFFFRMVFATLYPGKPYMQAQHVDLLCDTMDRVERGEINRLLIAVPPRYLKSTIVTVAYIAWRLGRNPRLRIIAASYGQDLANKLSRDFRLVVTADWYRRAFPGFRIDPAKNTETEIQTTQGGYRKAVSVEAGITGYGADMIIFDDPLKAADARSATIRRRVHEYFDETLFSRLDDKRNGVFIALQQRLHRDDLIGYLAEKGSFELLSLPAIAISHERIPMSRGRFFVRRQGEALHPERESLERLAEMRRTLGAAVFEAHYQQEPVALGGGRFQWSWFQSYDAALPREQYRLLVQSWDVASATGERNDFSVGIAFGLATDVWHIVEVIRGRWSFPELEDQVRAFRQHWHADKLLIEYANCGIALYQNLRLKGDPVTRWNPRIGKAERFEGATPRVRAGDVLIPRSAPWLGELRREFLDFPAGTYDDQVDAFSQFLSWDRSPAFRETIVQRNRNGGGPSGRPRRGGLTYCRPSLRRWILDQYDLDAPSLPIGGL